MNRGTARHIFPLRALRVDLLRSPHTRGANEPQSRFLTHSPACLALRNLSGAFDGIVILLRELATAFSWSGTAIIGIDYALKAGGAPDNRFAICSQVFGAEGSGLVFVVFNAF